MNASGSDPRRRSSLGGSALLAALILPVLSNHGAAEEEGAANKVAWETIRAWAEGTSAARSPAEKLQTAPSVEPAKKIAKTDDPAPSKTGPAAVPAWKEKYPGDRRPEPERIEAVLQRAMQRFAPDLKLKERYKDYEACWGLYVQFGDYNGALGYLIRMLGDRKRFAKQWNNGWIHGQYWRTDMMLKTRMKTETREHVFRLWQETLREAIGVAAQKGSYIKVRLERNLKEGTEYYQADAEKLAETLKALGQRGDTDPGALWALCERYSMRRPHAPLDHVRTLYKLRTWYPDHAHVVSGRVQWSIVTLLFERYREYEWAAEEAETLIEKWPHSPDVKGGHALWFAARGNHLHGDTLHRRAAPPFWEKALAQYRTFKQAYPKNRNNRTRARYNGPTLASYANEYIQDLLSDLNANR